MVWCHLLYLNEMQLPAALALILVLVWAAAVRTYLIPSSALATLRTKLSQQRQDYVLLEKDGESLPNDVRVIPEIYALKDEMIANRRWFHQHPELSYKEVVTAAKVVELLRSYGITEITEGVGRTGVVALIRGGSEGPCVALRADMDALPILESAEVEYKSQNEGAMHACGHDGHMTGLLAAAKVLNAEKEKIRGVVKLLFQPAEEGPGGAREMIVDGVLEEGRMGPRVDSVYGLHLWSGESA